jgi:hypothetical protein
LEVYRRDPPLSPEQIARCETQWRAWLRGRGS